MALPKTTLADENRGLSIFNRILAKAGSGTHRLLLAVSNEDEQATKKFRFIQNDRSFAASSKEALEFCELLAIAVSGKARSSGLVMRSLILDGRHESVCGWSFIDGDPHPLNKAECFDAYCTDFYTGTPIPPEPGVEHKDAPVIHL